MKTGLVLVFLFLTFFSMTYALSEVAQKDQNTEVTGIIGCIKFAWSLGSWIVKLMWAFVRGDNSGVIELIFEIPSLISELTGSCLA